MQYYTLRAKKREKSKKPSFLSCTRLELADCTARRSAVYYLVSHSSPMAQPSDKISPNLETSMQRISEIVTSMEDGNLPLEKLIDAYQECVGLVKNCQEKLDAAEKRIQIIARDARGTTKLEDFDPESGN
jgi:exodeoxyribonuclease VII small subunit